MVSSFPRQNARTQRFTLGAPRNFAITSDGSSVLFLRSAGPEDPVNLLWKLDLETSQERLVAAPRLLGGDGIEQLPEAERARRERLRESAGGITSYSVNADGSLVAFSLAGELVLCDTSAGTVSVVDGSTGAFDPRISPDGASVAFVLGQNLHVAPADGSGAGRQLLMGDKSTVSWGSAEFVAAEEMRRTRGYWWSPDGTKLAVTRVDVADVAKWHISAPNNPAGEPRSIRYPAAGTANAHVELHIVELDGGTPTEVRWEKETYPYLVDVMWDDNAPLALVVQSRDQRSMCVLEAADETGDTGVVVELSDPEWVEIVPGSPRRWRNGWLTIEENGSTRALLYDGEPISGADQWVRSLISADESSVVFTASTDPTVVDVYRYTDTGLEALSNKGGVANAVADSTVTIIEQAGMDRATAVTVSRPDQFETIKSFAAEPPFRPNVVFHETGPLSCHTAVIFPSGEDNQPLPILLDPYGGPHAQRVMKARNAYLASQWIADQGFCVVIADGPGTPGRGAGWERSIRGDLAEPVLQAQVDALADVAKIYPGRVDPNRVGIRGWSFGGYLAALAVMRRPDLFHAAVAGAPVTDWKLYDTHYTERYLGHPETEPGNYDQTSLLKNAKDLRRPLMLIHGLADDNVVAAHTLQLSSALLSAGRPHEVLPLSDTTHMTPQEEIAENLLLLQVDFFHRHLNET